MEVVKNIGAVLGYIATALGIFAVIKSATKKYVEDAAGTEESDRIHHELDKRMTALEKTFAEYIERDIAFKNKMDNHIASQQLVDRKLMADIIEQLYYRNREKKELDGNEFRRLTEVYEIYHDPPCNGNSYISEMYKEMLGWKRVH